MSISDAEKPYAMDPAAVWIDWDFDDPHAQQPRKKLELREAALQARVVPENRDDESTELPTESVERVQSSESLSPRAQSDDLPLISAHSFFGGIRSIQRSQAEHYKQKIGCLDLDSSHHSSFQRPLSSSTSAAEHIDPLDPPKKNDNNHIDLPHLPNTVQYNAPWVKLSTSSNLINASPRRNAIAEQKSTDEWQMQAKRIENLYISKDMSLKDVIKAMKDLYGFEATSVNNKLRIRIGLMLLLENDSIRRKSHCGILTKI